VQTRNDRVHAGERFVKPRSEWIAADDRPNEVIRLERAPFGFAVGRSIEQRMPLPPRWPARKVYKQSVGEGENLDKEAFLG
jgi:hypothetical protein